jgi:hypothetical protein
MDEETRKVLYSLLAMTKMPKEEQPGGVLSDKLIEVIDQSIAEDGIKPFQVYDALGVVVLDVLKRSHVPGDYTRREVIDSWIKQLQKAVDMLDIFLAAAQKKDSENVQ